MITALAWSPTRPELAVAGYSGLVQLWRADGTPRLARSLTGLQSSTAQPEAIQALTFSPNGQLLAASNSSKPDERGSGALTLADYGNLLASLAIWRASNGTLAVPPLDLETGHGRYRALAFNRDGRLLAVSRPDGSDLVLDTGTGQVRRKLNPLGADDTVSLAFAPNGTLATGTQGGIVQLWNPISGAQVAGPVAVAAGPVTSIAFDPDGRRFATTGTLMVADHRPGDRLAPRSRAEHRRRRGRVQGTPDLHLRRRMVCSLRIAAGGAAQGQRAPRHAPA